MESADEPKKRGPKGGVKHQPGRGHDHKSRPVKKRRFQRLAKRRRQQKLEEATRQWALYDSLTEEQRRLMKLKKPTLPRPNDD
jgi:hypothetical protein